MEGFGLARRAGFTDINADLIVGLPGDSPEGFEETLEQVLGLSPTNITVHSLAIKRSAELVTDEGALSLHKRTPAGQGRAAPAGTISTQWTNPAR